MRVPEHAALQRGVQRKPLSPPCSAHRPKGEWRWSSWWQIPKIYQTVPAMPWDVQRPFNNKITKVYCSRGLKCNCVPWRQSWSQYSSACTGTWLRSTIFRHIQAKICYSEKEGLAWKNSNTFELQHLEDLRSICKYWGLAQVPFYAGRAWGRTLF